MTEPKPTPDAGGAAEPAARNLAPEGRGMARLLEIMARLRHPGSGCPWDIEQTFETIAPYTLEEAYEVADAIAAGDMAALKDELGDLLFQVVYHARMAEEAGAFSFADVVDAISDKMIRRHPHVFGAAEIGSAAQQTQAWESHKAAERAERAGQAEGENGAAGPVSLLDGVPRALPALVRAEKLQKRAARVGFDWNDPARVLDKIEEELGELRDAITRKESNQRIGEELGDILFGHVNVARHLGLDAETALRSCNEKFVRRFRHIEDRLAEQGRAAEDATLEDMESLWQEAKSNKPEGARKDRAQKDGAQKDGPQMNDPREDER